MKSAILFRMALAGAVLAIAVGFSVAGAQPRGQSGEPGLYLPMLMASSATPPAPTPPPVTPSPQPETGSLPASIVGTWFAGQLLPRALYDPTTGQWGSANGLGQMYQFSANGAFTYNAFLRIENPGCTSEVSVYRQGTARDEGGTLQMQPTVAKTRTVVICGSRSESVTDGPYDLRSIPWNVAFDNLGVKHLTVTEDGKTTSYYKDGMAEELVGGWYNGELAAVGFYNRATDEFVAEPSEGWWIIISPDGHYRWGEYGLSQDQQGCTQKGWLYFEGTVSVSGSHMTFVREFGRFRLENSCTPESPRQENWTENPQGFSWAFHDFATSPKLVLMPDARFVEYVFLPG